MRAPSKRTGLSATVVGLLLAVILVAGSALGPNAFEFRAWPEPSRDSVNEVVAHSSEGATEVPVVTVRRSEPRRGGVLAVRGRDARRRGGSRDDVLSVRSRGDRDRPGTRSRGSRGSRDGAGGRSEVLPEVVLVEETPDVPVVVPVPPVGTPEQPDGPAQLAQLPIPEPVLRPDAEELPPAPEPDAHEAPHRDGIHLLEEVDELVDELLPDKRHRGRGGRGQGHR